MKMWIIFKTVKNSSEQLKIIGPWSNQREAEDYAKRVNERNHPDGHKEHAWVQEVQLVKP